MKKRISLTIDDDVLKSVDNLVDNFKIRSRSEAIENILKNHLKGNKTAVFLGGGDIEKIKLEGILKPLLKIGARTLIEHNIIELKKAGFSKIIFIGSNITIGEVFKVIGDGKDYNVDISYIEEKMALGNAKTLELAKSIIKSPFILLPVDNFFSFDINSLMRIHLNSDNVCTLAVQAASDYSTNKGYVEMMGNKIINYQETAKKPKTALTAMFIGIFNPEIFDYIPKGNVKWIIQKDIFPQLIKNEKIQGSIISGTVINIDSFEDVIFAKKFLNK